METKIIGITSDQWQRRRLKLPKGDIKLADGRVLRRIIGYDLSKIPSNKITVNSFLESAGWRHVPTDLIVSAGVEDSARWGPLLHASMSHSDHDPSWATIKLVRECLFPMDMDVGMILPRRADYVNIHQHCFHLWQLPQEWGMS